MNEQCALLFYGLNLMGMQIYRLVGLFPDCQPWVVVNKVDPSLLSNPSQLNIEVVRRAFQVPVGGVGVGKRVDWQGELTDGFEVLHLLKQMKQVTIGVHPDLERKLRDLNALPVNDTVVDSEAPSIEEKGNESVDDVYATQLPAGEPQGDGTANAGGNKPCAIKVGKGSGG